MPEISPFLPVHLARHSPTRKMRSPSVSTLLLCLGLFCLATTVANAVQCTPEPTEDFPKCNGTVSAFYSSLNCQGNVTYSDLSSVVGLASQCTPSRGDSSIMQKFGECVLGQPFGLTQYYKTSADPYGNCTQPFSVFISEGTIGACVNNLASNQSHAILCDASQVPFPVSSVVVPGPVILNLFQASECYAPDRCKAIAYTTQYEGQNCGRSRSSSDSVEEGIKLDTCYDYRDSPSSPSIGNVMYTFDGTFFTTKLFHSGCSGPTLAIQTVRANTCFRLTDGTSAMFKMNLDPSTSPVSQSQGPTGASPSMHGSIQMSLFVSLVVSFITMLLSVTA